jgi:hypothetical protein
MQVTGEPVKPPAQDNHIGGGKGKGQFIRWRVFIVFGIGIGFERIFNQLAGVKATPPPLEMELDAEAIHVGSVVTIIFEEVHGHRFWLWLMVNG